MKRGAPLLAAALLLAGPACEDRSYREIGGEINILAKRTDALVGPATDRLVAFGRRAVPQIETALHTASPRGKLQLLRALDRIGWPEATAIFRHFAVYDPAPEVRGACDEILGRWATAGGDRAASAKQAVTRVAEKRARGEGPLAGAPPSQRP